MGQLCHRWVPGWCPLFACLVGTGACDDHPTHISNDSGVAVGDSGATPIDTDVAPDDSGTNSVDSITTVDDGGTPALPACTWPAAFVPDGSAVECWAARVYLACKVSDGSERECLSDNMLACPRPEPTAGVTDSDCKNVCLPNEYALSCGGAGPERSRDPPANCRLLPPNPGGTNYACCPCGS